MLSDINQPHILRAHDSTGRVETECWNVVGATVYAMLIGPSAACVHVVATSYNPVKKSFVYRSHSGMTIVQDEEIIDRLHNTTYVKAIR